MPIHLFLVHFPVALLVTGAAMDLVGAVGARPDTRRWGGILLMLGAGAALAAFWSGQGALGALASTSPLYHLPAVEAHTQWGSAGTWPLAIVAVLRALWRSRLHGTYGWINLGLALLAAGLAVGIALSGTAIRHAA